MNKEEIIMFKLDMIYEQLFNIQYKIDKIENEKRKQEAEASKRLAENEIKQIEYCENDYWTAKEHKMKEFRELNKMCEKEMK